MDANNVAVLKVEIFSRIRVILYERYGEFIPASSINGQTINGTALKTIERFESFKADADLLDLFEALQKLFSGDYGYCLFCRNEIQFSKLESNPLVKFCDECERILSPVDSSKESEVVHPQRR